MLNTFIPTQWTQVHVDLCNKMYKIEGGKEKSLTTNVDATGPRRQKKQSSQHIS